MLNEVLPTGSGTFITVELSPRHWISLSLTKWIAVFIGTTVAWATPAMSGTASSPLVCTATVCQPWVRASLSCAEPLTTWPRAGRASRAGHQARRTTA